MDTRIITVNGCSTCPYGIYDEVIGSVVCCHAKVELTDDDGATEVPIVDKYKNGTYHPGCPLSRMDPQVVGDIQKMFNTISDNCDLGRDGSKVFYELRKTVADLQTDRADTYKLLGEMADMLELAINRTPTGPLRDGMCNLNILARALIAKGGAK